MQTILTMRRILLLLAVIILLAGAGVAFYFFYVAKGPSVVVAPNGPITLPDAGNALLTPDGTATTSTATTVSASLVRIAAGPIVPSVSVTDTAGVTSSTTDVTVRYINRQSGNLYAYTMNSGTNTRTSNKTIPGVERAAWSEDGLTAYLQYLSGTDFSTVNTYALAATGTDGFFLSQNLADISVSATNLLLLASGTNGSVGSLTRLDGSKSSQVFTTPLTSVHAQFLGKSSYLVYTNPAATLDGYAYKVSGGHFSTIAGPLLGLTALASHSGTWVLVSYTNNNALAMELVNTLTHETVPLPVATIAADKCVWALDDATVYCGVPTALDQSHTYPDDWYQGAVHFSDRIWKIDVTGRFAQLVLDFSTEVGNVTSSTNSLDATALAVDPQNTLLSFVNKNDGSLWAYKL